jgi:hypothetical protein
MMRFTSRLLVLVALLLNCIPTARATYVWQQVAANANFAPRDGAGALTFNGQMWLLGGWNPNDKTNFPNVCNSEIWSSTNGATWTERNAAAPWEGRHTAGYAVMNNRMWVVGGDPIQGHYQTDVWSSTNGVTWQQATANAPWGNRVLHYTIAHNNKLWVMGGQTLPQFAGGGEHFYNDVWNSSDGEHWTQVTANAPWSPRGMIGGAVSFKGRMWMLGGGTYETPNSPNRLFYNEVWSSADGVNWREDLAAAPWAARQYHSVAVFDNKMWVLAGGNFDTPGYNRNDVWYSSDGLNWTELPNTPWVPRHATSVFTYDNALWVAAGSYPGSSPINDVWKLTGTESPEPASLVLLVSGALVFGGARLVRRITGSRRNG